MDNGKEEKYLKEESLLKELMDCLGGMKGKNFAEGVLRALDSVKKFFAAEAAMLVYRKEDDFECLELHENSLEAWMKKALEEAKNGNFGEVLLDEVPKLVDSLQEGTARVGYLLVVQPSANEAQVELLSLLGEYMTTRIMQQSVMEQLEYETTHDHLTNLWNRNSFVFFTQEKAKDTYTSLGIITTDIIHLSELNEQFGYFYGSKKLVETAKQLKMMFGQYRIFRYDEDEMLVFCSDITKKEFGQKVDELKKKLEELPFAVSMGYSWSANVNFHDQIAEAEMIMGADKRKILHGMTVMQRLEQGVIDEVQDLLDRGQYLVYLQPKVDIHTGITEGAEALIRQIDQALGIVGPGMFIPVLERYNLVQMVDRMFWKKYSVIRNRRLRLGTGRFRFLLIFPKKQSCIRI